jgi:hypothetical protein
LFENSEQDTFAGGANERLLKVVRTALHCTVLAPFNSFLLLQAIKNQIDGRKNPHR